MSPDTNGTPCPPTPVPPNEPGTTPAEPDAELALELAAIIREVDGSNCLGAAALAKAILSHPRIESTGLIPQPMALQWTENLPPCEGFRYDHCIATTPLGRFVIECISWKEFDYPQVREAPWRDGIDENGSYDPESLIYLEFNDLDEAKKACQDEFNKRLLSCCAATAKQEPNNETL